MSKLIVSAPSMTTTSSTTTVTFSKDALARPKYLKKELVQAFLKCVPKTKFFSVSFVKRDGTIREMNCRRDVRKHLKGGESTIKHKKNLVSVWDTKAKEYRCFDMGRVLSLRGAGAELYSA